MPTSPPPPGSTQAVTAASDHTKYIKQWTLKQNTKADAIDDIDLSLAGTVFVSQVDGLPAGVLGYVNVTGDSQTVVDGVAVRNDNAKRNNHKHGVLNVTAAANAQDGYLLTEVFLSAKGLVSGVETQRSAQVVIEQGVLSTAGKASDLSIESRGSSAVYVSDESAEMSLLDLDLEAWESASIQLQVASISTSTDVMLEARDSASISVQVSSVKAGVDITLETQSSGTICTTAKEVTAGVDYDGEAASGISMPNASNKHGTKGALACDAANVPERKPSSIGGAVSSTTGTVGTVDSTSSTETNDSNNENNSTDTVSDSSACLRTIEFGATAVVSLMTMALL